MSQSLLSRLIKGLLSEVNDYSDAYRTARSLSDSLTEDILAEYQGRLVPIEFLEFLFGSDAIVIFRQSTTTIHKELPLLPPRRKTVGGADDRVDEDTYQHYTIGTKNYRFEYCKAEPYYKRWSVYYITPSDPPLHVGSVPYSKDCRAVAALHHDTFEQEPPQ